MSEVSLETESGNTSAEDPQMDCEEADKAEDSLSEDVKQENVDSSDGKDDRAGVLYDIDIDSAEEKEEEEGVESERVQCSEGEAAHTTVRVDNGERRTETPETQEESGDSHTQTKVKFNFTLRNQPLLALLHCAHVRVTVLGLICCFAGGGLSFL